MSKSKREYFDFNAGIDDSDNKVYRRSGTGVKTVVCSRYHEQSLVVAALREPYNVLCQQPIFGLNSSTESWDDSGNQA
jgi:hypothetical protein